MTAAPAHDDILDSLFHNAAFRIMPTGGSQGDARSGDWRVFIAA